MRVSDALGQIALIHQHLARGEVYRGLHPLGVAMSGVFGLAAALAQPWLVADDDPASFVRYWVLTAIVCGFAGAFSPLVSYLQRDDALARRRTRHVVAQFAPCVAVGFAVTFILPRLDSNNVALLPGLWALLFGLGVFATRPLLPRAIGWVGLAYLSSGALFLANPVVDLSRAGLAVGGLFAACQLATAAVYIGTWSAKMSDSTGRFAYEGLDRVLHEKARLGIMTSLATRPDGLSFNELKDLCALTDGNLNRHLDVLHAAGFVTLEKKSEGRRPLTSCRITAAGRKRFLEYLAELEQVILDARPATTARSAAKLSPT